METRHEIFPKSPREIAKIIRSSGAKIRLIGLYGSHAEGSATSRSDIDMFVVAAGNAQTLSKEAAKIIKALEGNGVVIDSRDGGLHIGVYEDLEKWKQEFAVPPPIPEFVQL